MTDKTLEQLISEKSPKGEAFRGGPLIRLEFEDLFRLYAPASQEAHDLYDRVKKLLDDNLTAEEWREAKRWGFLTQMHRPQSCQVASPNDDWDKEAIALAQKRALELNPGAVVEESWVFNLHSSLGVSVVIRRAKA